MFGSLIRRKETRLPNPEDGTFDSTTFTLSTAVPRPVERRNDERIAPTLRVAKLEGPNGEQLIRVRNVSAGGLMAEAGQPVTVGDVVTVELSSQKIPGSIVWIREGAIGVKFAGDRITATMKVITLLDEDIQSHVFGDFLKRQVIGELRFQF